MWVETSIHENTPCFQFKANFFSCTILQVTRFDLEKLENDLLLTIRSAPLFFKGSSIIIDLEKIKSFGPLNFSNIKKILMENSMTPLGVRNGNEEQHTYAQDAGFFVLPPAIIPPEKKKKPETTTKIISTPIRSGMQVYANGGDLVVTGAVSAGAELFADGNIHVYGPLRGRALAGVQGDTQARIFCCAFEAELVSIAGYYLTIDDIKTFPSRNEIVQIYLDNAEVRISTI
ncbi:MAG TPA: septum site-determining protein MinC [Gammaproteobacteria bacterium]|jgi:septum site-determining protein MinC|nr:septum site-determining protein MinC [Gammaproteobacteria bacterium]